MGRRAAAAGERDGPVPLGGLPPSVCPSVRPARPRPLPAPSLTQIPPPRFRPPQRLRTPLRARRRSPLPGRPAPAAAPLHPPGRAEAGAAGSAGRPSPSAGPCGAAPAPKPARAGRRPLPSGWEEGAGPLRRSSPLPMTRSPGTERSPANGGQEGHWVLLQVGPVQTQWAPGVLVVLPVGVREAEKGLLPCGPCLTSVP
ncbi:uncharacterized protein LOC127465390 [Manacus candei]|uniref:uncharacterized protein LOC127465390 n=1 Tax=Manacus candei TaxID=415023 RepID=UPI0022280CEF|nr:uncharacterized protein LOC127465390 [Manacus candei]